MPTLTFVPIASTSQLESPSSSQQRDSPSPTSRRFEAVIKRFGLDPTTPKSKGKLRREQSMPYITPPYACRSTIAGLAEPYDSPTTLTTAAPPPRPPRAPGRSPSAATLALSEVMSPRVAPSPSAIAPQRTPALPQLEPAFVAQPAPVKEIDDDQWRRDRRLSSLFTGLGLGILAAGDEGIVEEEEATTSEDSYEDAEEGVSITPSDSGSGPFAFEPLAPPPQEVLPPVAQLLLRQSWQAPADFVFRGSIDLPRASMPRRTATLPDLPSRASRIVDSPPPLPRTMDATPKARAVEEDTDGESEDDAQSCSATADVLDDYTVSPESQAPLARPLSRRTSTPAEVSVAAVRSWLPTLQPATPSLSTSPSPTPSFSSSERFDPSSSGTGSRTSWHSSELADDEAVTLPHSPSMTAAGARKKLGQIFAAVPMTSRTRSASSNGVSTASRPRRKRAQTESAVGKPSGMGRIRSQRSAALLGGTRSATQTPLIGSSPLLQATWRSHLGEGEYDALHEAYGMTEMRRQEVIAELCATETAFVTGLRGVVRVFFQPLRQPSGAWIRGVPASVGRLFDWLEDIVHLHSRIVDALDVRLAEQTPLVLRIADAFLEYIPRLEVHQPYLVRFEAVTQAIDAMAADETSDFGEFVRMQQALPECGAMTLSSFLLKPVQRLMKYPLFFKVRTRRLLSRLPSLITACIATWRPDATLAPGPSRLALAPPFDRRAHSGHARSQGARGGVQLGQGALGPDPQPPRWLQPRAA
jgi:hypothetical protein